jgi:hypothetical protein
MTFAVTYLRCSCRSWVCMLGLQWPRSGALTDDNAPSFVVLLMHTLAAVGPGRLDRPPHSNKDQCAGQQHHCGRCRWSCECSIFCCWFCWMCAFPKAANADYLQYHTCVGTSSGGLMCWGNNDYGQVRSWHYCMRVHASCCAPCSWATPATLGAQPLKQFPASAVL